MRSIVTLAAIAVFLSGCGSGRETSSEVATEAASPDTESAATPQSVAHIVPGEVAAPVDTPPAASEPAASW